MYRIKKTSRSPNALENFFETFLENIRGIRRQAISSVMLIGMPSLSTTAVLLQNELMRSFFSELRELTNAGCEDLEGKLGKATKNVLAKRRSASAPSSSSKRVKPGSDTFDTFKADAISALAAESGAFEVPTGVLTIDALPKDAPLALEAGPADGSAAEATANVGAAVASKPLSSLMTIYTNLEIIDNNMGRVKVFNNYLRAVIFILIQRRLTESRIAEAQERGAAFKTPTQQHIVAAFQQMCKSMLTDMADDIQTVQHQRVKDACTRAASSSAGSLQRQVSDYLRFYAVIQKYPALLFVISSYHGYNARLRAEFEGSDAMFKVRHKDLYKQLEMRKQECTTLLDKLEARIVNHISLTVDDL